MSTEPGHSSLATLRRLVRQARPFWPHLGGLFLVSLLTSPLGLLNPIPLKLMVDCVLGGHELPGWLTAILPDGVDGRSAVAIAVIAGMLVAIAVIKHIAEISWGILRTWIAEKMVMNFRTELFRHAQRISLAYHDTKGAGDAAYRIQYDAPAIQWVLVDVVVPLGMHLVTLGTMLTVLWRMDAPLAGVALAVVPALYLTTSFYGPRLGARWREAKNLESAAHAVVQEVLSAVRVVKAFVAEEREQARFVHHAGQTLREQLKVSAVAGRFSMVVGLIMATGTALVLFLGTRHVQSGVLTMGDLVFVMSYLAMLYAPLTAFAGGVGTLQGSLASADRAFALLDEAPEVEEKARPRPLPAVKGRIEFESVTFSYCAGRSALHDVSFSIAPGSRVGIAGHTGAGKSTIISLLLRFYDPTGGRILLDGVDIRDFRVRDLRNQFAIVLQEPVLFSASIGENIAYARPGATPSEIEAAARAAGAHDFIAAMAMGYDTPVGERGAQLSGGERQRISLARAFLKDAPILILDEPTSSVDVKTEAIIMDGMRRLMHGRTVFMIAHRLTTLDLCNVRLEVAGGKLVRRTDVTATG
jgi:ATP-binding cassette, subfamily B, bacterial